MRDDFLPECLLHLEPKDRPGNTPYELFPAGVIHQSGTLRSVPEEEIRKLLMRRAKLTLTGRAGILFKGLHYFVDDDEPYRFKSAKVDARYSENYARQIHVCLKGRWVVASLKGDEATKFGHLSFPEVEVELKFRRTSYRVARSNNLRVRVGTLSATVAETAERAQQELRDLHPDAGLRKQLTKANGKATNRLRDREQERRKAGANDAAIFPSAGGEAPAPTTRLQKKSLRQLLQTATA